jgi:N-sulfoglucosamine sulfohydrolase
MIKISYNLLPGLFVFFLAVLTSASLHAARQSRPNILWIVQEDMNSWMSCYGDPLLKTPTFDSMAENGVRFTRAYVTAPVCSASRSAFITGAMQTTLGTHHHRSSKTTWRKGGEVPPSVLIHLPERVNTLPELFQEAGYATFNQGKEDYNFVHKKSELYTVKGWSEAKSRGKPFFGQIQVTGNTHSRLLAGKKLMDPSRVTVPPYYPDNELYRKEVALHYDMVLSKDIEIGRILKRLEKDGLADDTIVIFFTDHGAANLLRNKQFCYEGGINVPLLIQWPKNFPITKPGLVNNDLVNTLDIGVTTLAFAGIDPQPHMEGKDLFSKEYKPREYVIAARDRCDYTIDRIRAVVTPRYKYIRSFLTDRPYLQPQYRDHYGKYAGAYKTLIELRNSGKMTDAQKTFCGEERVPHEFYDLKNDPHEIRNLANDPVYAIEFRRHQQILETWIKQTDDKGQYPESPESLRQVMKRWGDRCVNPEYKAVVEK